MRILRKRLLPALLAGLLLLGMGGCGRGSGSDGSIRLMVWSPSEDQSKDSGEWLQTCCASFAAQHPEWDITFVYGVADEATAANTVAQDPTASADVFMYANDNLTVLTDAQALAKLGGIYADEVASFTSQALLDSVPMFVSLLIMRTMLQPEGAVNVLLGAATLSALVALRSRRVFRQLEEA